LGRATVKITVDTNVLVRAAVEDDARQAAAAKRLLLAAEVIAITLPVLCEFAWVLARAYKFRTEEIASAIRQLITSRGVVVDRSAAEAGLAFLEAGGDFADGVIAFEGVRLGGETFVSFDDAAVDLARTTGFAAALPGRAVSR
jgi:predicted nucleic-acid-binding protein